jgi:hypothetical protein
MSYLPKTILNAVGFGVAFWVTDSLIDAFVFREAAFWTTLVAPEAVEIYHRLAVFALLLVFGIHRGRSLQRTQEREREDTAPCSKTYRWA